MVRSIVLAVLAGAGGWAQTGSFQPAQAIHIEPLGKIEIPSNKVLAERVVLQLTIDETGKVTDVQVWSSSGDEKIDAAAVAAAKKCLFAPATKDGTPVPSWYQIYYRLTSYRTAEYLPATAESKGQRKTPGDVKASTAEK